eukprot:364915-Chlamydomonas_euryale.AAC.15
MSHGGRCRRAARSPNARPPAPRANECGLVEQAGPLLPAQANGDKHGVRSRPTPPVCEQRAALKGRPVATRRRRSRVAALCAPARALRRCRRRRSPVDSMVVCAGAAPGPAAPRSLVREEWPVWQS